jgi:hypothetical protein
MIVNISSRVLEFNNHVNKAACQINHKIKMRIILSIEIYINKDNYRNKLKNYK